MFKKLPFITGLLLLFLSVAHAQNRQISGQVLSSDGNTLPGVSVIVKSSTIGTFTDSDGKYKLSVSDGTATLVFSFIGYETLEVPVNNQTKIDVTMNLSVQQLGEVVVVGYGTQLKQDLTGNISSVSGSAIQNLPVNSFEQAVQGRAAGVMVTAGTGKLGQGINVRVRGASSINANTQPLFVIDGMIVNTNNLSGTNATTNPMADINFNDIESIDILKDASAAAIYGARAANGVVLITTKKGKEGKPSVNVNMQYGSSKPTNHREFLNAKQYVELYREAALNRDLASGYDPVNNPDDYPGSWLEEMESFFDYIAGDTDWRTFENSTDWEKEAFQDAGFFNFDISASGGNDKTRYYFNFGRSDQDGILLGNTFKRNSGRLNLEQKLTKKFSLGSNINIVRSVNNRVADDQQFSTPMQLVAQSPLTPVRDKQGNLYDDSFNPAMIYYPATVEAENSHFITTVNRNIIALNAKYAITDNLNIIGEYGMDLLTQNEDRFQNSKTEVGRSVNGYGRSRWSQIYNSTYRAYANYIKSVNAHSFDVTLGSDLQKTNGDFTIAEGQNFPLDDISRITDQNQPVVIRTPRFESSFVSFFSRANYKFNERYLLSLSGRYDASSRFGKNNKWGFFPAASAGWIVSQENFLNSVKQLSFLKLKASYGLTGNADFANYQDQGGFSPAAYGGQPGLITNRIPNPDLQWEKTSQMDIGVDFGFFEDRVTGQFDYYNKQTKDLLLDRKISGVTGFQSIYANIGSLENVGYEVALNVTAVRNDDVVIKIGGNFSQNKNKVLALSGDTDIIDPGSTRFLNVIKVGQPIGVFYGPEYAGVDPANGDALWYVNGETPGEKTNVYANAQKVVLGSPIPTKIYGFNLEASYKGFDLSVLFQGVSGNKIFNAAGQFMSANGRYEDNQTTDQLRRWQKPGDITDVPQARFLRNNGAQISSRALSDGSYLRMRTITIGYNLPSTMLSRVALSSVRFYVTGQNMLTFTKYKGWDPEVNTDYTSGTPFFLGNDFYSAPQAKSLIAGVKFGF